jgi:hypothetical protein
VAYYLTPLRFAAVVRYEASSESLDRVSRISVERIQRLMLAASWSESIGEAVKVLFVNAVEDCDHGLLDNLVLQRRDP